MTACQDALATNRHRSPIKFTDRLWSSEPDHWAGFPLALHRVGPAGCLRDFAVPEVLLGICVDGSANLEVGSGCAAPRSVIRPGHFVLLDHGAVQQSITWTGTRETLYVRLAAADVERLLPQMADAGGLRVSSQYGERDPHVTRLAMSMYEEALRGAPNGPIYSEALGIALASYLSSRYAGCAPVEPPGTAVLARAKAVLLRDYLLAHLAQNTTLTELAALVHLSPHYLLKVFKNTFGSTPHQYVLRLRMGEAKRLLRLDPASICDVGLAVGFSDQSHFTSTFRRFTGQTPAQYRRDAC